MDTAADTPLRYLPGIGPKRAAAFAAAGLHSAWDLLHHVPQCTGSAPDECASGPLPRGATLQIRGRVERVILRHIGHRRSVVEAKLTRDDTTVFTARFFNATYPRDRLIVGDWYLFEGQSDQRQAATLNHPRFTHLARGESDATAARTGCDVSYRLPPGIGETALRRALDHTLTHHLTALADPAGLLPTATYQQALLELHRPPEPAAHARARDRGRARTAGAGLAAAYPPGARGRSVRTDLAQTCSRRRTSRSVPRSRPERPCRTISPASCPTTTAPSCCAVADRHRAD